MEPYSNPAFLLMKANQQECGVVCAFRGDYSFLSNFTPAHVVLPSERIMQSSNDYILPALPFSSTETAYMAWKSHLEPVRLQIQKMSAGDAKDFTHTEEFKKAQRPDYSDVGRLRIMLELNRQKFNPSLNTALSDLLIKTENYTLIEGNTWGDKFFGLCLLSGSGENYLGRILMTIRDERRAEIGLIPFLSKPILPAEVLEH